MYLANLILSKVVVNQYDAADTEDRMNIGKSRASMSTCKKE